MTPWMRKIGFVRRTPKVSRVGIVLRAESWFSRTSAVKFPVCGKWKQTWKFYLTSAGKSTFRAQNDTDKPNIRCTANKKYRLYHVRNVLNRASKSRRGPRRHGSFVSPQPSSRLVLALIYAFPHLIRNILFFNSVPNCGHDKSWKDYQIWMRLVTLY